MVAVPRTFSEPPPTLHAHAARVVVTDLVVAYRGVAAPVVEALNFTLEPGAIGCIVGSSGCGKTTLLRAIAGFLPVSRGTIAIGERIVARGPDVNVPPEERGVGLVFQDYALFPH